ncbi:MAG: YvcK family protein [Anaerolineales bacterium]|nr:YvcK family protein [Anaerolineales bacterium]
MGKSPGRLADRLKSWLALGKIWLTPGMGVKRWLIGLVTGTLLVGLGFSVFMLDLYRSRPDSTVLSTLALSFIPRPIRIAVLLLAGGGLIAFSLWRLSYALLAPFAKSGRNVPEILASYRRRGRGPQIVAVGGGHGLSNLLRGLKHRSSNLTAVVTVADDGGSSGRLRRSLGIPPPGDLRNCLAALAEDESLLTQLFQYRFAEGDGIHGHAFGNLFVTALAGVTGSFERSLLESGRVLSICGKVVPSTLSNVTLEGELIGADSDALRRVSGQAQVQGAVWRVWLEPEDVRAYPEAVQAILSADMIVVGPGSLFTSVLPNLLIGEIREAIAASRALKVYVCNVAAQPGETDGFSVKDHLEAIERHMGFQPFHGILVNAVPAAPIEGAELVGRPFPESGVVVVEKDLADSSAPGRHDPQKLAAALMELFEQRKSRFPI